MVTYDRETRTYAVGNVVSDYLWMPEVDEQAPHVRRVEWTHRVARDALSLSMRNTLGSIMTFLLLSDEAAEEESNGEGEADLYAEVIEKADEFIEDRIARLSWQQLEHLVAGILRAMGYRTQLTNPGADRGYDIFASPDGLGLQEPRIFVEVKHHTAPIGAPAIRSFLGARRPGERGLYVSTGGFTREAHYEAERSQIPIHLVNMQKLRHLLLEHYDQLDTASRALVPLQRLYWPIRP